jgi:3-methyladenine DNA glycosylase AlkD
MKYWQTTNYINNTPQEWNVVDIVTASTVVDSSVETIVKVNTLNNTYLSQISENNSNSK